ncbi:MAG: sugar-transfer associated ATP-grasp domain-containing protein, partial [Akkermansia sp.]
EKLAQHAELSRLNESSLNTMRVTTYRDINKRLHWLPQGTFIRYGAPGAVRDNVAAGGDMSKVYPDGSVDDRIFHFRSMEIGSLRERGISSLSIPHFERVPQFALQLHERLPYFDLIGWDITLDAAGEPTFVEFNFQTGVEAPQMLGGPFFDESFLEEVVERLRGIRKLKLPCYRTIFANGFEHQIIANR